MLSNAPKPNGFTPKEIFTGAKGARYFKNFHTFGSPTCVLHPIIADGKKLPTWKTVSKPDVFLGKSRQHASNVSLVHDPSTHHIFPQFHVTHDDDYQTVAISNSNKSPSNWKEAFTIDHQAHNTHFRILFIPQ